MSEPQSEPAEDIEVGQTGAELRYWCTKEALRQAEAKMKSQSEAVTGLMTRATAVLGWTVTGILASAAVIASQGENLLTFPAVAAALSLLAAALCALLALWPREWGTAAWDIDWFLSEPYSTELAILDAMAQGAAKIIEVDQRQITRCAHYLRSAYLCLFLAPLLGWAALLLSRTLKW